MAGLDQIRPQLIRRAVAGTLAIGLWLTASACFEGAATATTPAVEPAEAPGDSLLPMATMLARFRSGLAEAADLDGGAASRDELVRLFIRAVETADSATLQRLAVTKAEYAYLYFPTSVYASTPYELPPDVAWTLSSAASDKGRGRVVQRLAGHQLNARGYACADSATEGQNRFWRSCTLDYDQPGEGRAQRRLFGTIIERDGHYKFLSYSNDF